MIHKYLSVIQIDIQKAITTECRQVFPDLNMSTGYQSAGSIDQEMDKNVLKLIVGTPYEHLNKVQSDMYVEASESTT